ncbi:MAG: c-type cytochrome [Polyangiaceae bacterium]|jgi:cytochrome c oxidase cbb3-type subunit III
MLPLLVRLRPLLATLIVLLATVVSGTLQCEPPAAAVAQAHGREIYSRMCAVCHGAEREGYKADQAPSLAQQDFLASVTPEFLTTAIANGRIGTTMSAWGIQRSGPLAAGDVAAVVSFLRSWQESPAALLDERPLVGDATRGGHVYQRECAGCHGAMGTGGKYLGIGNPQLLASASDGFLRHAIRRGRPGTPMPGFEATLGDGPIDDLVVLLRGWQVAPPAQPPRSQPPGRAPPLPLGPVPLNPTGPEPEKLKAMPAYTSADLIKAELDRGARMAILDARAPSDYTTNHIQGAVSVPFYAPEPYLKDLPKDAWLVCYCGCPHAESGQLAHKLLAKGFTKVAVLDEGLGYWVKKKYPTSQGISP